MLLPLLNELMFTAPPGTQWLEKQISDDVYAGKTITSDSWTEKTIPLEAGPASSEAITLDADLTPLQWLLQGSTHFSALTNASPSSNISAVAQNTFDLIGMTAPTSGDIVSLTSMTLAVQYNTILNISATFLRMRYQIFDGTNSLGSFEIILADDGTIHTDTYTVNITGGPDDVSDLRLEIKSDGSGWTPFAGLIQISQIVATLNYTTPFFTEKTITGDSWTEKTIL